jgi:hypothetical protein
MRLNDRGGTLEIEIVDLVMTRALQKRDRWSSISKCRFLGTCQILAGEVGPATDSGLVYQELVWVSMTSRNY